MKREIKAYIYAVRNEWAERGDANEYSIHVLGYPMENSGAPAWVLINETTLEVDFPLRSTLIRDEVAILRGLKQKLRAACEVQITAVDSTINNLLAITNGEAS